jgi:hypothetical protein
MTVYLGITTPLKEHFVIWLCNGKYRARLVKKAHTTTSGSLLSRKHADSKGNLSSDSFYRSQLTLTNTETGANYIRTGLLIDKGKIAVHTSNVPSRYFQHCGSDARDPTDC